jgi:hypothetical protein
VEFLVELDDEPALECKVPRARTQVRSFFYSAELPIEVQYIGRKSRGEIRNARCSRGSHRLVAGARQELLERYATSASSYHDSPVYLEIAGISLL